MQFGKVFWENLVYALLILLFLSMILAGGILYTVYPELMFIH